MYIYEDNLFLFNLLSIKNLIYSYSKFHDNIFNDVVLRIYKHVPMYVHQFK